MKHTILLAAASQVNLVPLMEASERLLNASIKKSFKVFYLEEILNLHAVAAGMSQQGEIDRLVSKVENELLVEKYAKEHGFSVELLRHVEDELTVSSQSSVADLMIVDLDYEEHLKEQFLANLFQQVDCPILLLPKKYDFDCLVAVHDASKASVKTLKDFLKLFDENLMKLPFSLLMEEAVEEMDMKRERVFINYLKLFFEDMGAQHIHDDPLKSLYDFVQNECDKPMLCVNNSLGMEIVESDEVFSLQDLKHPIFISKD